MSPNRTHGTHRLHRLKYSPLNSPEQNLRVIRITFRTLFLSFLAVSAGFGVWWLICNQTRTWPITDGVIDSSSVIPEDGSYSISVQFHYLVDGTMYHSSYLWRGFSQISYGNLEEATELVAPYAEGNIVSIVYHPNHPEIGVLMVGAPLLISIFVLIFAGVTLIVGVVGWIISRSIQNRIFHGQILPDSHDLNDNHNPQNPYNPYENRSDTSHQKEEWY